MLKYIKIIVFALIVSFAINMNVVADCTYEITENEMQYYKNYLSNKNTNLWRQHEKEYIFNYLRLLEPRGASRYYYFTSNDNISNYAFIRGMTLTFNGTNGVMSIMVNNHDNEFEDLDVYAHPGVDYSVATRKIMFDASSIQLSSSDVCPDAISISIDTDRNQKYDGFDDTEKMGIVNDIKTYYLGDSGINEIQTKTNADFQNSYVIFYSDKIMDSINSLECMMGNNYLAKFDNVYNKYSDIMNVVSDADENSYIGLKKLLKSDDKLEDLANNSNAESNKLVNSFIEEVLELDYFDAKSVAEAKVKLENDIHDVENDIKKVENDCSVDSEKLKSLGYNYDLLHEIMVDIIKPKIDQYYAVKNELEYSDYLSNQCSAPGMPSSAREECERGLLEEFEKNISSGTCEAIVDKNYNELDAIEKQFITKLTNNCKNIYDSSALRQCKIRKCEGKQDTIATDLEKDKTDIRQDNSDSQNAIKEDVVTKLPSAIEQSGAEYIAKYNVCNEQELAKYVKAALKIIRICGPILVVLLTAWDGIKTFTSFKDEAKTKFFNRLVVRIICLILLFIIPTIIDVLIGVMLPGYEMCLEFKV